MRRGLGCWLFLIAAGCGDDASPPDATDAAVVPDAGSGTDAGLAPGVDGGLDAGSASDAGADAGATPLSYGMPVALGRLAAVLPETSGIVASRTHADVFWLENDSGNPADIFAVDRSAALLATIHVMGATNVDWEDFAIHDGPMGDELYIGDVGDNLARTSDGAMGRMRIRVYRLAEPDPAAGDATVTAEQLDFQYPVRPYDCESLFVDHRTGDLYFVTKESSPAEVFVARAPLSAGATRMLENVGTIDFDMATAADMSRDSARIVVRGYGSIQVYSVAASGDIAASLTSPFVTAMSAAAAEAITFEADGYGLYTVPEGTGATLFYIPTE